MSLFFMSYIHMGKEGIIEYFIVYGGGKKGKNMLMLKF